MKTWLRGIPDRPLDFNRLNKNSDEWDEGRDTRSFADPLVIGRPDRALREAIPEANPGPAPGSSSRSRAASSGCPGTPTSAVETRGGGRSSRGGSGSLIRGG